MRKRAAELKRKLDGLYEEIRKRDITELHIIVEETIEVELTDAVREEREKSKELAQKVSEALQPSDGSIYYSNLIRDIGCSRWLANNPAKLAAYECELFKRNEAIADALAALLTEDRDA